MASIKISSDTSEAKKSILDLGKSLKSIGTSKVSIFNAEDKKFLKGELKKEMAAVGSQIKKNSEYIQALATEQSKLIKGSKDELEVRKRILETYKQQSKLGRDLSQLKNVQKDVGGSGIGGMISKVLGGTALAIGAFAVGKTIQSTNQYMAGTGNRVRLSGLGGEQNTASAKDLARVGLTEQDLTERRVEATAVLGRQGSTERGEMQKAGFERAFGLQAGTMTMVAASLRGSFGGAGANTTQAKLQASIATAGIQDAIGPYLESMTSLLASINENGATNVGELISNMASLTKAGGRTPEQLSKTFGSINSGIQNASGDANAFIQTAFARAGIGGGTIGGTKFAMESGGLFGLDKTALGGQGFNPGLLENMDKAKMFSGMGDRSTALTDQLRKSGGLGKGQSISDVTDVNQMVGINSMANQAFGTKGKEGFQAALLMEQVRKGKMSEEQANKDFKKFQEGGDPNLQRLDKINETLAGQTEYLSNIDANLSESLGKEGVVARNAAKKLENAGTKSTLDLGQAINSTGVVEGAGNMLQKGAETLNSGEIGGNLADMIYGTGKSEQAAAQRSPAAVNNMSVLTGRGMGKQPIINNINITLPDGKVMNSTHKGMK